MLDIAKTLLSVLLAASCVIRVAAQEYTIAKLKLFPDREQVLIKDIAMDSLGFIWFLTNGEIYRYDGYRSLDVLKTIADQRRTDDIPQCILVDHCNRLWMAGNTDLSYLDLKTWKVHAIDSGVLPSVHNRMVRWVEQLADSAVMVGYENGHLLLVDGDRFVRIDELYRRNRAANRKEWPHGATYWNGKYWVHTSAGNLLSIDPTQRFKVEYRELPDAGGAVRNVIANGDELIVTFFPNDFYRLKTNGDWDKFIPEDFSISVDDYYVFLGGKQMHVYADRMSAYLLDTNLAIKQHLAMPLKNGFGPKHVCIAGNEAVLGAEEGIFVIYPKTKGLSQFIPPNKSANKSTRGIYVYPDGAFFYSTYEGAGFVESDGTVWPFDELRHSYVLHPINDNELFVGTEGAFLKVFDRKRHRVYDLNYKLPPETAAKHAPDYFPAHVMSLAETDTDYLIGSSTGLWKLDKATYTLRRFDGVSNEPLGLDVHIRYIQLTSRDGMLLSTDVGLFEVVQGEVIRRYPLSGNLGVYKTLPVGDTLWIATQGKGLVAIDSGGQVLQTITTEEGLSHDLVYSLEYTDGVFVAGTADGLNLINGHRVRRIGRAEGLSQSEFNSGASFWDAPRQRMYVGGLMGYAMLDMTQPWFVRPHQLESYVTEIHTSRGNIGAKSADYTWPYRGERTLELQPDQSLTGLYVGTPGNHRTDSKVRYALNAGDWEPLELGQFISLIEPSPGNYRLRLETRNAAVDGRQKEVIIVKHPHYYQTWWFRMLVLLAIALMIWRIFKYRENIQRKEKKMRVKIASDLHDEVGSSLTRIYFQADMLSAKGREAVGGDKQLRQIANTSKQALLTMSDMVWSIDSRFDTVKDLVIRMKDYLYKVREELEINYRFDVQGDQSVRAVSQLIRQNLFLIFKEALTNAIKYGDGSEIAIELNFGRSIQFAMLNRYAGENGLITNQQGGRGLESMQQRAARVGGALSYTAADGLFQLTLVIP